MKNIITILNNEKSISAWRIIGKATKTHELFFVHGKLETARVSDTSDKTVTVYVDHDGRTGDSSFNVYRSMTDKEIAKKTEVAAKRAALVFNERYSLPEADSCNEVLRSSSDEFAPAELAKKIADSVFAADDMPCGSINALEVFVYDEEIAVSNSNGVDKKQTRRRVMLEAIPTYTDESGSVEICEIYNFTDFDAKAITEEIKARMLDVKARAEAKKPKTPIKINVILRPYEIAELMDELAYDINYASVYSHANLHSIGDDLQEGGSGDKLNITMRSVLKGASGSACFDDDGSALKDVKIIDNGVIAGYFGSKRFGDYLKIASPSGNLQCMEVAAGTMDKDNLGEPYIECAFMSALQVDLYKDYIGGEIRLAYYYDGKTVRPITGITMSAKLSDVLKEMRLSKNVGTFGTRTYFGPEKLLMKDVTVL